MAFETGLDIFKDLVSSGRERTDFAPITPRLEFISWKDGQKRYVRFLTDIDEMIRGQFAQFVITRNGGFADFLVDPHGTNWVEKFGAKAREFGTGNLVTPKLRKMGVAVVVERDEKSLGGGRTEIVDKEGEVEVNGKKYKSRIFGVVIQSQRFWELFEGHASRHKTICDVDFEISRRGTDKTTHYPIVPIESDDKLRDHKVLHETYGYGKPFNAEDPDRFLYCPQTIQEWAADYSGERRARFLLAPQEETVSNGDGLDEFAPVELDEAQSDDMFADLRADFRDKLKPHLQK